MIGITASWVHRKIHTLLIPGSSPGGCAQGLTFNAKPEPAGKDFSAGFFYDYFLDSSFLPDYAIYFSLFFAIRLGLEFLKTHRESAMQIHTRLRQRNSSPRLSFPSII
jgi:hypothetical protein